MKTTLQIKKMQYTENKRIWYSQDEVDEKDDMIVSLKAQVKAGIKCLNIRNKNIKEIHETYNLALKQLQVKHQSDLDQLQKELKEYLIYSLEKQNLTECDSCHKKINSYCSRTLKRFCHNCMIDSVFSELSQSNSILNAMDKISFTKSGRDTLNLKEEHEFREKLKKKGLLF